ncbi:Nca2p [Sporobolomyces salmoneus]|uniref:Nca2p n=1 Tax=Sporobolomyces salmoneus TaxID=183962 RepID=UPI0031780035
MSYASDLTASLSNKLAVVSPSLVRPTPSPSSVNLASADLGKKPEPHNDQVEAREAHLRSTLAKLRPSSHSSTSSHPSPTPSAQTLAQLVDDAFPPFQAAGATPLTRQTEGIELVTVAQLTIAAYGTILRTLMQDAAELGLDDDYWARAESDPWKTGLSLLQTGPQRFTSLATITASRLKQLTTSSLTSSSTREKPSLFRLNTWRRALPPSLFLTSVFPHLSGKSGLPSLADLSIIGNDDAELDPSTSSTSALSLSSATRLGRKTARSLFFLTLSPLALTRHEIAEKRSKIKKQREELASKIGKLTLTTSSSELGSHLVNPRTKEGPSSHGQELSLASLLSPANDDNEPPSLADIRSATWSTLRHLDSILTPHSASPAMASIATPPSVPSDLAHSLHYILSVTFPTHLSAFKANVAPLRKPSFLVRSWPYLLSIPLVSAFTARTIYNNRQSLINYAFDAVETTKRFVIDWVVEPVKKILDTVRGGETMALMGRDSLRSDLESLERMVVDFARDEYHLSGPELEGLAQKVRSGDLTTVLKAWEQDIKSPIRSAVGGSLIRTLLIQVQKVKVDVALAMDGIEKMLKSQQLTFGFVGVAPSMLILVAFGRWVRGLTRSDGGAKRKSEERKKCWMVVRQLDLLLSPPRPSQTLSASTTQGLVLLSLSSLRSYAYSRQFPSRDTQLLAAFLEDVRALEDLGARAGKEERKVLVGRLRRWGTVLGWKERIKA